MKIAIVTGIWKRPEVFEMFAKGVKHLQQQFPIQINCYVAGSEGKFTQRMVERHGFTYIEVPNDPLSIKMNAPIQKAGADGHTHYLCLGSDDIISVGLMKYYIEQAYAGAEFIGVTDFYFYDTTTKQAIYWGGYREKWRANHTAGAGRMISDRLMRAWNYQPFEVKHSKILDNSIQDKLNKTPHIAHVFSLKEKGLFALDIKSSENMTPFKLWDNSVMLDPTVITSRFNYVGLCAE